MSYICRNCGCTEDQAKDDARTLDLQRELREGIYNCCQIVAWADEQWLAWMEAAEQDDTASEDAFNAPEEDEKSVVRIRAWKNKGKSSLRNFDDFWNGRFR